MPKVYVGKNHLCGFQWWNSDICGLLCCIMTWLLMAYGQFGVITIMMQSFSEHPIHQSVHLCIFECLWIMAFLSHLKTMLTNPGTVPKGTLDDHVRTMESNKGEVFLKCTKCSSVRPERAHHCSICDRCVRRMDHHCPWVNNCVGEGNQKYFILFTFYICLVSFHTLYWSIHTFVICINDNWHNCSLFSPATTTILIIFLLFESMLFGIFTVVMFGTQITSICFDQTGIESLRNERGKSQNKWKNLQVVLGGPCSLGWLNPFDRPFVSERAFEFSV